jgi:N-acetylmuramoyl-L-alanine amidase
MRIFQKFVLIAGLQLLSVAAIAGQAQVSSVQFLADAEGSRMVFNVSDAVSKGVFLLNNPARLVIDLKNTHLRKMLPQPSASHPLFAKVRSAERNNTDLRIVVDLKKPFSQRNLKIAADKSSGQIIVGVLANQNAALITEKIRGQRAAVEESHSKNTEANLETEIQSNNAGSEASLEVENNNSENLTANKESSRKNQGIVIAIDAGHGGNDAGAHGPGGTQEKKVVFAIAKRLAQMINGQPGMWAVMVRKGDYYIGLRKRMEIAREAKADLFVSIHADAINDASVKGASVYTLSNTGASSEAARWLANSENSADLVGGVSLDDKDDVLASVLLDLSQSATKEASRSVASKILKYFNVMGRLHKNEVQKAAFMVLKSPDIPSILVETAFISNPTEENELRSSEHQVKVAGAVFKGIASYFREYAPAGTRMASSQ